jgi:hypothetical protein
MEGAGCQPSSQTGGDVRAHDVRDKKATAEAKKTEIAVLKTARPGEDSIRLDIADNHG